MSRWVIALSWCLTMPTVTKLDRHERERYLFTEMGKLCAAYRSWERSPYRERVGVEEFRQYCVGR